MAWTPRQFANRLRSTGGGGGGGNLPTGGTTGQALVKNSNTNYDSKWADISSGLIPVAVTGENVYEIPSPGRAVLVTASGIGTAVVLPQSPPVGSLVAVRAVSASPSSPIQIAGNFSTSILIEGQAIYSLTTVKDSVLLSWSGTQWRVVVRTDSVIPVGGTTGQILAKANDSDFVSQWVDPKGSVFINVLDYGAVGDGATDNTSAIQAAIQQASTNSAGGVVYFPPRHSDGSKAIYCFGSTLNASSITSVTLCSEASNDNQAGVELRFTGGGSGSAITFGSSRGFGIEQLAVTYSNAAFTGTLLNGRIIDGSGDTCYSNFYRCWFGPSTGNSNKNVDLVLIDGSHNVNFTEVKFWSGKRQLIGKLAQGITSSGGFAIHVTVNGCAFAGAPSVGAIVNPDESWYVNAVAEPGSDGKAGFITHTAGVRARGLVVEGTWAGDATVLGGSWITFAGEGLTVTGGSYHNNSTVVKIDENNTHGVVITGVALQNQGIAPVVVYANGTTGHTGLTIVGTDLSMFSANSAVQNPPSGSIIQAPDRLAFNDIALHKSGESYSRLRIDSNGVMAWSDGSNAVDCDLYRGGVKQLTTDYSFKAIGGVVLGSNALEVAYAVQFNTSANEKADIVLTGATFGGMIEVTLTGHSGGSDSVGLVRAIYSFVDVAGGSVATKAAKVTTVVGTNFTNNFALMPMSYNSSTNRFRIPIAHRTTTSNKIAVNVRYLSPYSEEVNDLLQKISISSVYTTDATVATANTEGQSL